MNSVQDCLIDSDPLTRDVALFLISYSEEDDRVDYKQCFDPNSERSWLELAKDVTAFANTWGGYLVFGVTDSNRTVEGISRPIADVLKDVNNLHQKINRHIEPHIVALRSKEFRIDGKRVVIVLILQSIGSTHMIGKEGSFTHPSGKEKVVLRRGTFYVRRSASNHLGDSRDLRDLIERRIDQFRDSLMDKVARIIKAPDSSETFILTKDPEDSTGQRFVIENSPESIPIKGMSFTVAPEGPEEEIAAWSVISRGESESRPPASIVWKWYANRERLQLSNTHMLSIFTFSLWNDAPPFYWIRNLKAQEIRVTLLDAIRSRPLNVSSKLMLVVASFLGKGFYSKALSALGAYRDRVAPAMQRFPVAGPRASYGAIPQVRGQTARQQRTAQMRTLNDIASASAERGNEPPMQSRWAAHKIDCFLYAKDDKYT